MTVAPVTLELMQSTLRTEFGNKRNVREHRDIAHETRFEDLGLDSLEMHELGLALENQIGRALPDKLEEAETVGEIRKSSSVHG